jgi:peroxiredoxin
MRFRGFVWLLVRSAVIGLVLCGPARAAEPCTDKLGQKIDRVTFTDAAGKPFTLRDLKDRQAVLVVFLSFECPVSTSYSEPLAGLARTYGERGVTFLGVSTGDEDAAQLAKYCQEYKIPFPVYKDERHAVAEAFHAAVTPEAFLLDRHLVLRYRGRIDDSYAARLKKNLQITRHDLRQALDELLAGKPVSEPATRAVGCPISHEATPRAATGRVTFYRDVLPILQSNCQTCHRPGEVGPFALMTYRQAVNWAGDIKGYTQSRKMPPWKPVDGPAFQHDRKLSNHEIATLAAWADGGTPAGDPKDAPPPRRFVEGWQLGQPDLVLTPDAAFQVGAGGPDLFRCYVLPTNLPEDRYVTAFEVRPGNRRVVHHTLQFIDTLGQARKLERAEREREKKAGAADLGPGYSSAMGIGFVPRGGMGGWAPGQVARHLPEGTGYFLPKGADLVLQVHYHRDGRVETDRPSIGLYFARKPVQRRFQGLVVAGGQGRLRFFAIPAGKDHVAVHGRTWVDQDCTLYSVMPHMHLIGREVKVTMTPPGGPPRTLVAITDWDYNWQETYFFKEPIAVKTGTRFDIEAVYDNSTGNPNNPNQPPRLVTFGQQTTDEMLFGFLGATSDRPGRIKQRAEDPGRKEATAK